MDMWVKLNPQPDSRPPLPVPRYITIMQKCVEHKIPDVIITQSHFNDLYVLIMSIDIANLKHAIQQAQKAKNQKRGYAVRDVSAAEAVKFLTGG